MIGRHCHFLLLTTLVLLTSACGTPRPPRPAPIRAPTVVNASAAQTWDALTSYFEGLELPIREADRSFGKVATDQVDVTEEESVQFADCGESANGYAFLANWVAYQAEVRGDDRRSSILITAIFHNDARRGFACESKGWLEIQMEDAVKELAEGGSP